MPQRALGPALAGILTGLPVTAHPMDTLRTAVSLLGAADPAENDNTPEANQAKALRLFAAAPSVVALDQRRRRGEDPVPPRDDLGFTGWTAHIAEQLAAGRLIRPVPAKAVRGPLGSMVGNEDEARPRSTGLRGSSGHFAWSKPMARGNSGP
jgi:citrate synthase